MRRENTTNYIERSMLPNSLLPALIEIRKMMPDISLQGGAERTLTLKWHETPPQLVMEVAWCPQRGFVHPTLAPSGALA